MNPVSHAHSIFHPSLPELWRYDKLCISTITSSCSNWVGWTKPSLFGLKCQVGIGGVGWRCTQKVSFPDRLTSREAVNGIPHLEACKNDRSNASRFVLLESLSTGKLGVTKPGMMHPKKSNFPTSSPADSGENTEWRCHVWETQAGGTILLPFWKLLGWSAVWNDVSFPNLFYPGAQSRGMMEIHWIVINSRRSGMMYSKKSLFPGPVRKVKYAGEQVREKIW